MSSELKAFIIENGENWIRRINNPGEAPLSESAKLYDPTPLPGEKIDLATFTWRILSQGGEAYVAHHNFLMATAGGLSLRPSFVLSRTAAIAAVRTLYILSGESRTERRKRALQIMNDDADTLTKFSKIDFDHKSRVDTSYLSNTAKSYQKAIGDELEKLGLKARSHKSDSDLFELAAEWYGSKRSEALENISLYWNHSSAIVHARALTWNTGLDTLELDEQLCKAWGVPAELLEYAWDAWQAAVAPTRTQSTTPDALPLEHKPLRTLARRLLTRGRRATRS
ncbi:hypothetical protein [Dermabacter sp.]|uniref:hypothetical protein n=1 Tax=Dermabacter sp. TaxID=37640 RepID=UPI00290A1E27|nr:hypothetical protein [Dermabacter sp.]MDU4922780.1 hypothetical protein [Dermabacter sp.]